MESGLRGMVGTGGRSTYDSDNALGFEQVVEPLNELLREKLGGLGAPGKDVVNYIPKSLPGGAGGLDASNICHGVFDDGGVILREGEVFRGEIEDYGVDFYGGGMYTVGNKGSGRSANSEPALERFSKRGGGCCLGG